MKPAQLLGTVAGVALAPLSFAASSISGSCVQAYHAAIHQANSGQKARALATVNCILMPDGITVGIGGKGAMGDVVNHSISVWGERLPNSPLTFTTSAKPDLKVLFVPDITDGEEVQGEVHCQRQVFWGSEGSHYKVHGTIYIRDNVNGRRLTEDETASVIEHELGHVLGLDDEENPGHLMGPFVAGSPVDGPSPEEVRMVASFRGALKDVARQMVARQVRYRRRR